jgi:DNA repair exonuclease SbcCD nuclease subunit
MIGNRIALVGDIHVGVNKNSEDFFNSTVSWFVEFISKLEQEKINHVFILGDWHHYRDEISVKALDLSSHIMNLFPKNIHVHILTGNHDCYFKDNSDIHSLQMFKGWENVTIYDKVTTLTTPQGSKTITVVPWGCEASGKCDYVFGHFEINNFKMNNYTICNNGVDSTEMLKSQADVYTGHFHKYQKKEYKTGSITYVGSPIQHNFNDVGNKNGFHILNCETGDCEFVENSDEFSKFIQVKLSKISDFDFDLVKNNYVKLIVDKDVKESLLEKLIVKINSANVKNLIVDDITMKNVIDKSDLSDNISEVNIENSIDKFIDLMSDIKYITETKILLKKYYEEKTK